MVDLQSVRVAKFKELEGKIYAPLLKEISDIAPCESIVKFTDTVEIDTNLNREEQEKTLQTALNLRSWRKGPFRIDETFIDAEWRSFIKFNILRPHIDLDGKVVGDIGCNNGYYLFKMLPFGAKKLVGFDPGIMTFLQFKFINHFVRSKISYELLGVEHLPYYEHKFDTLFCLGVIYHRSDPIKMLKDLKMSLNSGGELFLDTMYLDMYGDFALTPKQTYSKISNIYFVPTISALINWCERANFKDIKILATKETDFKEQRKTEWILGQSLENFLDLNNPKLTIEGYPAPRRVYLKLKI
ncbi:tRNA 5-methoxyuridine(34)/uridine 5-oxyacetic acid(34) synthase CmoB [Campylobacter sp. RM16187]|uniref:tRNA 5-methoxyuridine(34)/uridine 5-oxyacetic acid(34) synthase CmoB n=1 Tax=Campylobacter sp. RM16187 TaxID=1660063 RepID=UPI0021B62BEA|nr:tRNA 5-methoxyuridine(34)/uridine 5-oxyacetic acid(34) synthase CmoB [Campylobacter sp. RM16187]QKG29070.1 tRNA (cmo5U34)-carboxymethyltransferase [Campylobacter sp. RM16187]